MKHMMRLYGPLNDSEWYWWFKCDHCQKLGMMYKGLGPSPCFMITAVCK